MHDVRLPFESPVYCSHPAFHAQLLDTLVQAVVTTDLDDTIIYVNRAAEDLCGWSSEEFRGKKINVLTSETNKPPASAVNSVKSGKPWTGEWVIARRDRSEVRVTASISPLFLEGSQLSGCTYLFEKPDTRIFELPDLILQKDQLQSIVDLAPAFICTLNGPEHVFQMANPAFYEVSGHREVLGRTVREVFPEVVEQGFIDLLDGVYSSGKPYLGNEIPLILERNGIHRTRYVNFLYLPLRDDSHGVTGIFVHGVDVTEQVRAREQAISTSRYNNLVMENSLDVICLFDADGVFVQVSDACRKLWGYEPEELVGLSYRAITCLEDIDATSDVKSEVVAGANVINFKNRVIHKNGCLVDMLWTSTWADKDQLAFAVGRDVTTETIRTRALAERDAALEKSERRLRRLVHATAQLVWSADPEGNITEVSGKMLEYEKPEDGETLGWSWIQLLHPDDQGWVRDKWKENLANETDCEMEYRARTSNGTYRWIGMRAVPVYGEAGGLIEWIGTCTDIHARKHAESELREREKRYRMFFEIAQEGVCRVDRLGNFDLVNEQMTRYLGYSADEICGQPFLQFIYEEDRAAALEKYKKRHTGVRDVYDVRFLRKNGTHGWVRVSASPIFDGEGNFDGSVAMVDDITERKQIEEALVEAKRKAEEMARLKSSLLASMSHEIRTPLTAIIGYAELLMDTIDGQENELVKHVYSGAERLLDTLNSVMDLAQLEGQNLKLTPQRFDIKKLTEEIIGLFSEKAARQGLYVEVISRGELIVNQDRGAVSRVLTNLISNAIKFTREGGICVSLHKQGHQVQLDVTDTGVGIDPAFQPFVFDEFRQESDGLDRSFEGSGLGLTITKRLVDLMKGTIQVSSVKGEGTTFTVELSDNLPDGDTTGRTVVNARRNNGRIQILVVEDDLLTQVLFKSFLQSLYDIEVVGTGEKALELLKFRVFDVMIFDINLPGSMSGDRLLQEIRSRDRMMQTPAIAVTAYALPGERERFIEVGFDAFLSKPFKKARLLGAIEAVVQGGR